MAVINRNVSKAIIILAIADWQLAIGDYFPTNQSEAVCKCFALIG